MINEKIVNRIRKMIALRDNEAASQGEIENATALVQRMLLEYNLTMDQISEEQSEYNNSSFNPDQRKVEGKFIPSLYNVVARYHLCHVIVSSKHDNPRDRKHQSFIINIIGKPSDIEVVEYLCSWLAPKIRQMANESWNSYDGPEKQGKFKRGYYLGCVTGISVRLREQKQELESESKEMTALVLRADIKLKEAVNEHYPNLGRGKSPRITSRDGNSRGFSDGKNISLNRGLANRQRGQIK